MYRIKLDICSEVYCKCSRQSSPSFESGYLSSPEKKTQWRIYVSSQFEVLLHQVGRAHRKKAAHILAARKENATSSRLHTSPLFPSGSSAYGMMLLSLWGGAPQPMGWCCPYSGQVLPIREVLLGNTLTDALRGVQSFLEQTKLTVKVHHFRLTGRSFNRNSWGPEEPLWNTLTTENLCCPFNMVLELDATPVWISQALAHHDMCMRLALGQLTAVT